MHADVPFIIGSFGEVLERGGDGHHRARARRAAREQVGDGLIVRRAEPSVVEVDDQGASHRDNLKRKRAPVYRD